MKHLTERFDTELEVAMQENPFWLLVANSAKAKFYRGAGPQGELEKFHEMSNEEARMKNQDLETDRPGRVKTPTGRAQRGETDPRGQAIEDFAVEVGDFLDDARGRSEFSKVSIVAPPKFLGDLKNHLDAPTADMIIETVSKNLVDQDVSDAQAQLERFN